MKRQILLLGVFLSSLIIGCTQDEALESISNESDFSNEIKKVETLFESNMQEEKDESAYSDEGDKIEASMSYEDRLVYYDYINRNGSEKPTPPLKTTSRSWTGGSGLVLKAKGVRCYPYDELILVMDCEDHKEKSYVSGNTGETFVDSNGNVHFFFCIVPRNISYGGLNEDIATFKRFFDCEDSDNNTRMYINGYRMNDVTLNEFDLGLKGDGKGNITFFFAPPSNRNDGFGRFGESSNATRNGIIYTDDEDDNNINYVGPIQGIGVVAPNTNPDYSHNTILRVYF